MYENLLQKSFHLLCEITPHLYVDFLEDLTHRYRKIQIQDRHGSHLDWKIINPTERHDWINQRDGLFDTLIHINSTNSRNSSMAESFFVLNGPAVATGRDSWTYNFSMEKCRKNISDMIKCYNECLLSGIENTDAEKISWTAGFLTRIVIVIGVREPPPKIFPPSLRDNSPLVR